MAEHSLVCLVITVFVLPTVILKFCQIASKTSSTIYLDTSGFPFGDIAECPCRLTSLGSPTSITIAAVPSSRPGDFQLEVAGKIVNTPVQIPYKPEMEIILRKKSAVDVVQCLSITGDFGANSSSVMVIATCSRRLDSVPAIPGPTENSDDIESGNNKTSTDAVLGAHKTKDDDDGSNTGVIAGAASGVLLLIIAAVVVAMIVFRRTRENRTSKDEPSDKKERAKDPEYDMTINEGYASADDIDMQTNDGQPVKPPVETYEEIDNIEAVSKTFTASNHDALGYTIVNKPQEEKRNHSYDLEDDNEYNRINDIKVDPPTRHIYGVGTPINP